MISGRLILYDYHKPTKKGYPIKILITEGVSKKTKPINLKIYSELKDWDKEKQEPKKSHPEYFDLLEEVIHYKSKLLKAIREARLNGWNIDKTIDYIKGKGEDENFLHLATAITNKQESKGKNVSIKRTVLNSLERYSGEIMLSDIDINFVKDYRDWCLDSGKFTNNGVHTYLRTFRALYNQIKGDTAPFKGVMPKLSKTRNKYLEIEELKLIKNSNFNKNGELSGAYHYTNYFMLCFYLGGIDLIDLANLRYDKHIINDRVLFQRFKGGTDEWIDNKLMDQAKEILKGYDCKPYLVPIHKSKQYRNFYSNYNRRIKEYFKDLGVESYITSKSPRYSFINIAKNIGISRDIVEEIVGHSKGDVHSIYEGKFPNHIKDEAHLRIIQEVS